MSERMIMDSAGDLWQVEAARPGKERGTSTIRCRHELGYELSITVAGEAEPDDRTIVEALERARRWEPRKELAAA